MTILDLRILPPLAIGRLGGSETPLEAYELVVDPTDPVGFRQIQPRESFVISPLSGDIQKAYVPEQIRFRDPPAEDGKQLVRPVAPFLEVFALTDEAPEVLQPLTLDLLRRNDLDLQAISWNISVGNIKIFRRTGDHSDKIIARLEAINDHELHPLLGECANFLPGKTLPLGSIRFIRPTAEFPEIRLRFIPAKGQVYGSSHTRIPGAGQPEVPDPILSDETILYDQHKGTWRGYVESSGAALTTPAQIFAGYQDEANNQVSWGYFDDECDGFVSVSLQRREGPPLTATAHIGAGPPAYAPDSLPPRAVSDELEQIMFGPEVNGEVRSADAEDIVRRSFECLRLMNVAVMNGNSINGRQNIASTMVRQDSADFERMYEPIMATSIVDTLAVRALHQRVFGGLASGFGAWFADTLRRPEEVGDLSDAGRRKMPALMRNADGRALCLTRRMIDTVVEASRLGLFGKQDSTEGEPALTPSNRLGQLHHRGMGNPFSVLPRSAISNCFPGLEFDFRNLWRRALEGIVLLECNNLVVDASEEHKDLIGRRLLSIDGHPTMVETKGPIYPGGSSNRLSTSANPNAVSFLEWSNALAHALQKPGQDVLCEFTTAQGAAAEVEVLSSDLAEQDKFAMVLKVRRFFDDDSAAFTEGLVDPGELTQGLCSPWQNDYRECACYYWAASRPDYVNVEPGPDGQSKGDMWLAKKRTGTYIPDDRTDSRLVSYDDLFRDWQNELRFIIGGFDRDDTGTPSP